MAPQMGKPRTYDLTKSLAGIVGPVSTSSLDEADVIGTCLVNLWALNDVRTCLRRMDEVFFNLLG